MQRRSFVCLYGRPQSRTLASASLRTSSSVENLPQNGHEGCEHRRHDPKLVSCGVMVDLLAKCQEHPESLRICRSIIVE